MARGQILLVHPSPNRHAIVGFFMRAIACIMFPSSHAAVGAYPRLDAVSSIIASSHSLIFLLLTSFSPESAVAASVSRSLSVSGPCFSSPFGKQLSSSFTPTAPTSILPPRRFFRCAPHPCHHLCQPDNVYPSSAPSHQLSFPFYFHVAYAHRHSHTIPPLPFRHCRGCRCCRRLRRCIGCRRCRQLRCRGGCRCCRRLRRCIGCRRCR